MRRWSPSPLGGAALVAVGTCVAEVIQKIEFTRQASAVTVSYPFVFQPSAPPTRSLRKDRVMFPRVLRQHREQLQACYETELRKQPDLSGTVTATFTVEADGTVSKASATGVDPAVSSCVANAIKLVVFERPVRKTDVSYPFVFEALGAATPITSGSDDDTMNGSMPISTKRETVPAASFVCSVENRRWPVSEASMAISAVSRSRISPTRMMSGSIRR